MTDEASISGTEPGHDLEKVVQTIAGELIAVGQHGADEADTGPKLARLCSPMSLLRGDANAAAVVIFGSASEVEKFTAAASRARGATVPIVYPGLFVIGPDVDGDALPAAVPVARVADVRLALARLSHLFDNRQPRVQGRHETAVIEPLADVADSAGIGPGAVIGTRAVIGAGTVVGPNSVIGKGSRLGSACIIHANVTIYDGVTIGDRVILHSGAVIGADGFGYAGSATGAVKIHHAGGVVLHDDVEVGANTAIDRGTIDATVVGPRTKIDNLCQLGHNVTVGSDCLIAGTTAIGGSCTIGNGVIIGGNVAVSDHVTIGDGARVAGRSGVTKDVPAGETWAGFPAVPYRKYVRSLYLSDRLDKIWDHVKSAAKTNRSDEDDA